MPISKESIEEISALINRVYEIAEGAGIRKYFL